MYSNDYAIRTYRKVLSGELKRFPTNFWSEDVRMKHMSACVKFLIEEVLFWDFEGAKKNLSFQILYDYHLAGGLRRFESITLLQLLQAAYPRKKIYPWELRVTSMSTWKDKESGVKAVKWLIEEKLQWNRDDISNYLTQEVFARHHLRGCLQCAFNGKVFDALDAAYPGSFTKMDLRGYRLHVKSAV